MSKRVLSINIDAKDIFVADMDYTASNPTVYKCFSISLQAGMVEDGTILDVTGIAGLIRNACEKHNIHTKSVIFTLSSSKIATREVSIPYVAKPKIQAVIEAKASEYFPINVSEYTFAYSTRPSSSKDKSNKAWELLVFAAPNTLVHSYDAVARILNFDIMAIDYDGNSIYQLMKLQKSTGNCMAIQINNYNTVINVISNQQLMLQRVIPYGISTILDAIVEDEELKLDNYEEAMDELIKKHLILERLNANEKKDSQVYMKRQEITDNFSYLINNFLRVMDYFGTKFNGQKIDEIMLTGIGSKIMGIQSLMQNELGVAVSLQNTLQGVKVQKKLKNDQLGLYEYMVCFGAVFRPVKFVTRETQVKEQSKSSNFSIAIIFGASLVLCVVMIVISTLMLFSSQNTKDEWEYKVSSLNGVEARFMKIKEVDNNINVVSSINQFANPASTRLYQVIQDMNKMLPKSAVIVSMSSDENSMVLNFNVDEKLENVTALKMKMDEINGVSNVTIGTVTATKSEQSKKMIYSFSIMATLDSIVEEVAQ